MSSRGRPAWNGRDWYITFGERTTVRDWDDARHHGFVSAGGGDWYARTLRAVPVGARVFVCIPTVGFVGVGTVAADARPFDDSPLADHAHDLRGTYRHEVLAEDDEEWILPVRWQRTVPREEAIWERGMFANQNSACRLRHAKTLNRLTVRFDLDR